jgi:hypothetical protein
MKFMPKVNCQYYIYGTGCCSNKNVKRRWFFGLIGPRYCMLANPKDWRIHCDFRVAHKHIVISKLRWPKVKHLSLPTEPPKLPPPSREVGLDLSKFFKRK